MLLYDIETQSHFFIVEGASMTSVQRLLSLAFVGSVLLFALPGLVAAADPPSAAGSQATFRFDIPGGPLEAALAAFEAVTGLRVEVPSRATVQSVNSPGVSGTYSADQALERLLAST